MKKRLQVLSAKALLKSGYDPSKLIRAFVSVNQEVWGSLVSQDVIWNEEAVQSQFSICPQLQYCAILDGNVIGTVSTIYIDYDDALQCKNWKQLSANRMFQTHNPDGDSLFGLDLSVLPKFQAKGVAGSIIETTIYETVVLQEKRGVFLGSRIPSFHKHSNTRTVEDHVFGKKRDGKTMDPEIRLYQREGFEALKIVPDYIEDPESLNYGVLMFWKNKEL